MRDLIRRYLVILSGFFNGKYVSSRADIWCPIALLLASLGPALFPYLVLAQAEGQPQSIHTVYVAPMGEGSMANAVRKRLEVQLSKSGKIRIINDEKSADAVLHGDAVIWQTGTLSLNPRSNSVLQRNYQGYFSANLSDASNHVLWSYLVTPSRFRMANIVDDLSDQLSAKLIKAIGGGLSVNPAGAGTKAAAGIALRVAGATFPAPLYQLWFQSFGNEPDGFPISYDPVGSVAGLAQLTAGKVDMAASDIPSQGDATPLQMGVLHVPTVIGAVVPIYNLAGESQELNLTGQVLADIFSGKIRKWNDPRIRQWNSGAVLPNAEISVIHRSDGSGTTYIWTSFLAQESPDWKTRVGASIDWPVGIEAAGNEGIAEKVEKIPNSIGYVELTYAIQRHMTYAAVRNPAGRFIRAGLESITAAVATHVHSGDDDLRFSALNTRAKEAYPITTFTWLLVPKTPGNPKKEKAITEFLHWMLTTGQKQCASLGYAPLPSEIVHEELSAMGALQ